MKSRGEKERERKRKGSAYDPKRAPMKKFELANFSAARRQGFLIRPLSSVGAKGAESGGKGR